VQSTVVMFAPLLLPMLMRAPDAVVPHTKWHRSKVDRPVAPPTINVAAVVPEPAVKVTP
jgi:hypothetical protein